MENKTASNYNDLPLKAPKLKGILLILFLVLLDQGTKYLAIRYLRGSSGISLIDNVLNLRYLENRGMAFGLLQNKILFLVLTCIVFFVAIIYLFIKAPATVYYRPLLYTAAIVFAGAMGNFIDRVFRGYVVDFIYFSLIDFPVFNLADIYVVASGIFLILFVCTKYRDDDFSFLNIKR